MNARIYLHIKTRIRSIVGEEALPSDLLKTHSRVCSTLYMVVYCL